jgi:hypothetical protein
MSGKTSMYTSPDERDMATEKIADQITAEVMQELHLGGFADSVKKTMGGVATGASNYTKNYAGRMTSLHQLIGAMAETTAVHKKMEEIWAYKEMSELKILIENLTVQENGVNREVQLAQFKALKDAMNLVLEVLPVKQLVSKSDDRAAAQPSEGGV